MIDLFQRRAARRGFGLVANAAALALATATMAQTHGAGAVALEESPLLSPTVQALPRLVGDSPALQALNRNLALLDARDAALIGDCPDLTRNVNLPMSGPDYLSFEMDMDKSCGGEFAGVELFGITFDLTTGAQLDWAAAIPGWNLTELTGADYGLWASSALSEWFSRRMLGPAMDPSFVETCGPRFQPAAYPGLKFKIWTDAYDNVLVVMAVQPDPDLNCFSYIYLRDDLDENDFAEIGLDTKVVEALHAAHAAENFDNSLSRPGGARPWTQD